MEDVRSSSEEIASELAEQILRPLTEVCSGMMAKLSAGGDDGGTPFILHRNQWSRLVQLFSSDLNYIKHRLKYMLARVLPSLRYLYSAMEAARKSFEECVAPHARGYFSRRSGEEDEYVWTGPELGDAEEEADEEEEQRKREDVRVWMAKHALTHILDREILHRHADNFCTASLAHVIVYTPSTGELFNLPSFNIEKLPSSIKTMSELSDDTRQTRAFFSHEEMLKIDISQLLLHRLRDDENVEAARDDENAEAAVEALFVDRAQFRKCDDEDSGSGDLGKGGFGSVKLRKWISDDHHVAVKKGDLGRQEIGIQARVRHPNVLPLLCCSTAKRTGKEQTVFLPVMERMDSSLDKLTTGPLLPLILQLEMMLQIAKGMEYLHSHDIVHRDLKPPNILVSGNPDYGEVFEIPELPRIRWAFLRVKVADFGVSKLNFQTSDTSNTPKVGTGFYRAPEVLEGYGRRKWRIGQSSSRSGGYSRKADVYSFAMVCYRIVIGDEPFHDDPRPPYVLHQKIRTEALRPKFEKRGHPWPALRAMLEECWHQNASRRPEFVEIVKFLRILKLCALQLESKELLYPTLVEQVFDAQLRKELFQEFRDMDWDPSRMTLYLYSLYYRFSYHSVRL